MGRETKCLSMWPILLLLLVLPVRSDDPSCVQVSPEGNNDDTHRLHFSCFCASAASNRVFIKSEEEFSLAQFAYGLSGALFAKSLILSFHSCRFLRLRLDHRELRHLGSPFFRPDLQLEAVLVDHVYHLDLQRSNFHVPEDEYLPTPEGDGLELTVASVALVVVQRGADFARLEAINNGTVLYIDLNESQGSEGDVHVDGFRQENIFFITNGEQEVPLNAGEDLQVKMRSLTEDMQDKSHLLSVALSLSTVVILLGIFGLVLVANHRQKRKRQLKDILRAKNLGPQEDVRKIAREVSDNFLQQQQARYRPPKLPPPFPLRLPAQLRLFASRDKGGAKLPMNTADIELNLQGGKRTIESVGSRFKRLDFNELISSIMYRMRRTEFTPEIIESSSAISTLDKQPETSFFYKQSSVSASPTDKRARKKSSNARMEECVNKETLEVPPVVKAKRHASSRSSSSSSSSATTSASSVSSSSDVGSYVSKISHFVTYAEPREEDADESGQRAAAAPPKPTIQQKQPPPLPKKPASLQHKSRAPMKLPPPPPPTDFHGELKEKCMTFFSSVTRIKKEGDEMEERDDCEEEDREVENGHSEGGGTRTRL